MGAAGAAAAAAAAAAPAAALLALRIFSIEGGEGTRTATAPMRSGRCSPPHLWERPCGAERRCGMRKLAAAGSTPRSAPPPTAAAAAAAALDTARYLGLILRRVESGVALVVVLEFFHRHGGELVDTHFVGRVGAGVVGLFKTQLTNMTLTLSVSLDNNEEERRPSTTTTAPDLGQVSLQAVPPHVDLLRLVREGEFVHELLKRVLVSTSQEVLRGRAPGVSQRQEKE